MKRKDIGLLIGLMAVIAVVVMAGFAQASQGSIALHNNTAQTDNADCPDEINAYWHFVFAPNSGAWTFGTITLNIGGTAVDFTAPSDLDNPNPATEWIPGGNNQTDNVFVLVPAGSSLDDLELTGSSAVWIDSTPPNQFNLSHVCTGGGFEDEEHLTVTKTVDTSYDREHFWDISKKVETEDGWTHDGLPKIWLYADGRGNEQATWTVDVTYEGYVDSNWNVSGTITVTNDGDTNAVVNSVEDVLAGTAIDVNCEVALPYELPVDESFDCSYSEAGYVTGKNVATATTAAGGTYSGEALIVWGDPANETNETVNVSDISDLLGSQNLGSVTAPTGGTFTYTKDFAWADYGAANCGDYVYDNEATIDETGQSADATLKVNVQCLLSDSAWAKGSGAGLVEARCFTSDGFNNWGWTNLINATGSYTWTLWAGAAKCDTGKGFNAGTVSFDYSTVTGLVTNIVYSFNPGITGGGTAVYSGSAKYPKAGGKDTTAPGKYKLNTSTGSAWVIAHANVQYPDPNFGP